MSYLQTERSEVRADSEKHQEMREDGWVTAYTEDGYAYMIRQRDTAGNVVTYTGKRSWVL